MRPRAFEHAKPLRRWREQWPPVYEQLLEQLLAKWADGRGIREFLQILALHRDHSDEAVQAAVTEAMTYGAIHAEGVKLCLSQAARDPESPRPLTFKDGEEPEWAAIGDGGPPLSAYNDLLGRI